MRFSESDFLHVSAAAFLIMLGLVCGNCWSSMARADGDAPTPAEILAQAYVAEAEGSAVDYAAIFHALSEGAERRGVSLTDQAVAYSSIFRARTSRSRWVLGLSSDLAEPDGWPRDVSWERYGRPMWSHALAIAETDLVFPPPNPCNGTPRHWGGMDIGADRSRASRAVLRGDWHPLTCGTADDGTLNRYYAARDRFGRFALADRMR